MTDRTMTEERVTEEADAVAGAHRGMVGERLGLRALDYAIPEQANRWTYMLGGLTAFFLVLLVLTGLYLAQFYNPNPLGAHDSILYIIARAPFGDWVRSLHYWSAGGVVVTVVAHLVWVFWRRSYRKPREVTWWAGVGMVATIFLLLVTGTALRYDQEGFEALAHFVAGGGLTGTLGRFFTEAFTVSTPLLSRIYALHTSLLPLVVLGLMALHFWLIRHLGIHADRTRTSVFRKHVTRLTGLSLLAFAVVGALALLAPEGLGYPPVAGEEVTKPFWPVLWVYGLENVLGPWGMILGPVILGAFLAAVPLLDRSGDDTPGRHGWVGWAGLGLGALVLAFWLYGVFGKAQQHIGM
ncbi:MAG TPA: cytochrome b N-terminal domain-containing protein [Longimicrobiales bacterium]|nr:cytochrome b N-terminal domain-containing protein [Longimicrobiales bacterium]